MTRGVVGRPTIDYTKPIIVNMKKKLDRAKFKESKVIGVVLGMKMEKKEDIRAVQKRLGALCNSGEVVLFIRDSILWLLKEQSFFASPTLYGTVYSNFKYNLFVYITGHWNSKSCSGEYSGLTAAVLGILPFFDRFIILSYYLMPYSYNVSLVDCIYEGCDGHYAKDEILRQLKIVNLSPEDGIDRLIFVFITLTAERSLPDFWLQVYYACKHFFNQNKDRPLHRALNSYGNRQQDICTTRDIEVACCRYSPVT